MLPWRVTGKKLFWSRDRLIKHEFECLGLRLGLVVVRVSSGCAVVRIMNSFGVMVRVRVGIMVYVKPFCLAANHKNQSHVKFWASELIEPAKGDNSCVVWH